MEPRIPDKSIVVINTDIKELDHKNVAVFLVNGNPCIRNIFKQNGTEYLVSVNQNYDPIFLDQHNTITIVGKVIRLIVENFI
jgi:phage repressor protein C with HTH and peptisase S24 domain